MYMSKVLSMALADNSRLGNRMPIEFGKLWKRCPWYKSNGIDVRLNEAHVLISCAAVTQEGLQKFVTESYNHHSVVPG